MTKIFQKVEKQNKEIKGGWLLRHCVSFDDVLNSAI